MSFKNVCTEKAPVNSTVHGQYDLHDRSGWPVHTHKEKLIWVVQYDATERTATDNGRPEHWSVYYAIEKRKKGAAHWSHNNKRLGDYMTLEDALRAGDAYEERKAA